MEERRGEVRSHIQPGGKCPWEVVAKVWPNGSASHTVNSGRMSLWPPGNSIIFSFILGRIKFQFMR